MQTFIGYLLNLPWMLCGLLAVILSGPQSVSINKKPWALVFKVKSLWWYQWLPGYAKTRAIVNGYCVQLGPRADEADLLHELIHVEQYIREPFIHPFLYIIESWKHGYRANRYEEEAYTRSGSRYEGK